MYNSIKIANTRITYIEKNDGHYFIGLGNGDIVIINEKFKIINTQNIFKNEIRKICIVEDNLYVLGIENKIAEFKLLNNEDENKEKKYIENFLKKNNIHVDYYNFFNLKRISEIENFIKLMEIKNINYVPKKENIFRSLSDSI